MCRSSRPLETEIKIKIANFCNVKPHQVVSVPDAASIYSIPSTLECQKVVDTLREILNLDMTQKPDLSGWDSLLSLAETLNGEVNIVLVGKYTKNADSYASVIKALGHSALACRRKLVLNCVEATNLETIMKLKDEPTYNEAWTTLRNAE